MSSLVHVYQSQYVNSNRVDGLGDFLRGSYSLLGLCERCNIFFSMCINHPINQFLQNINLVADESTLQKSVYYANNVTIKYKISNSGDIADPVMSEHQNFVEGLLELPVYDGTRYLFCNHYPIYKINKSHKEYVKKILEPNAHLSTKVDDILRDLNLQPKRFVIIHVRVGDDCLLRNDQSNLTTNYLSNLFRHISNVRTSFPTLLITDSNEMKRLILLQFRTLKAIFRPIVHFGEGVDCQNRQEEVENTLIDFFLLSKCARIFSFSSYSHGTGFSRWCAETYDIPYSCKFIDNEPPKRKISYSLPAIQKYNKREVMFL